MCRINYHDGYVCLHAMRWCRSGKLIPLEEVARQVDLALALSSRPTGWRE